MLENVPSEPESNLVQFRESQEVGYIQQGLYEGSRLRREAQPSTLQARNQEFLQAKGEGDGGVGSEHTNF